MSEKETLVLQCLRATLGLQERVDPAGISAPVLDGAIRLGMQNLVLTVMDRGLSGGLDAVSTDNSRRRKFEYWTVTQSRNRAILSNAARITALFDAEDIPHVYFKGPLQQFQVHGDAFQRPSGDLDLLVRHRDITRAHAALTADGHHAHTGLSLWWLPFLGERHYTAADHRCIIDLHRKVQQPGLPQPVRAAGFIDKAERLSPGDAALPVVSPTDQMLITACNIVKGLFSQGRTAPLVCDLMAMLSRGDAAERLREFERACAETGLAGTGAVALDVCAAVFGEGAAALAQRTRPERSFDAEVLQQAVLNPDETEDWPRKREISAAACGTDPLRRVRVGAFFLASETARAIGERWEARTFRRPPSAQDERPSDANAP